MAMQSGPATKKLHQRRLLSGWIVMTTRALICSTAIDWLLAAIERAAAPSQKSICPARYATLRSRVSRCTYQLLQ